MAQTMSAASEHTPVDLAVVEGTVRPGARAAGLAILRFLRTYAGDDGRVGHPVDLPKYILEDLCGDTRILDHGRRRRAANCAVDDLVAAGVLALHTNYSTGRHGKRFTVWYTFGSGVLPAENAAGELELGRRQVEEGELVALLPSPTEPPRVRFEALRAGVAAAADTWWRKMYERRAFTPAEFFEGDARKLLPGPFRDRYAPRGGHAGPECHLMPAPAAPAAPAPVLEFGSAKPAQSAAAALPAPALSRAAPRPPPVAPIDAELRVALERVSDPGLRGDLARVLIAWERRFGTN